MDIILFHNDERLADKLRQELLRALAANRGANPAAELAGHHAEAAISIRPYYCHETWDEAAESVTGACFDPFYHSWTQLGTTDLVINLVDHAVSSDEYCYERYHYGLPGLLLANRHFLGNPHIVHVSAAGKADSDSTSDKDLYLLSRNQGDALFSNESDVDLLHTDLFSAGKVPSSTGRSNIIGRLLSRLWGCKTMREAQNQQHLSVEELNSQEFQLLFNKISACISNANIPSSASRPEKQIGQNRRTRSVNRRRSYASAGQLRSSANAVEPFEDQISHSDAFELNNRK